jgi:hypothetical protein
VKSEELFGVRPAPPLAENKIFNSRRRTVTMLVEGAADAQLWRKHTRCIVRVMRGKDKALGEIRNAKGHPDAALVAVLDADFDRLLGTLADDPNVVWTDAHDLETTLIFFCNALDGLLGQFCEHEELAKLERSWGHSFLDRLTRHMLPLAKLRFLKRRDPEVPLQFKKESGKDFGLFDKYEKCVSKGWTPHEDRARKAVIDYSQAHSYNLTDAEARVAPPHDAPPHELCNGHDLVGFLAAGLRELFKIDKDVVTWTELLIASVEQAVLESTTMVAELRRWEEEHPGFSVLR